MVPGDSIFGHVSQNKGVKKMIENALDKLKADLEWVPCTYCEGFGIIENTPCGICDGFGKNEKCPENRTDSLAVTRALILAIECIEEFADLTNPNEPKYVCWPTSEYMKKARNCLAEIKKEIPQ